MRQKAGGHVPAMNDGPEAAAHEARPPNPGLAPRRIECDPGERDRVRGSPRSGRGRGVREGESSGRIRRHPR